MIAATTRPAAERSFAARVAEDFLASRVAAGALVVLGLIALAALSLPARTFALDYRLTPEHPFPAQLEDAVAAYRWLLDAGVSPRQLILMGDSAGANLTLALLLKLRDLGWPLPAGAVALCPWTDVGHTVSPVSAMAQNDPFDFPQRRMVLRWAGWLLSLIHL